MTLHKQNIPAFAVIAAGIALIFAAITMFRPLMPVDETRYLSVAWEMMLQGHWILPTLNFEPYSHKPPMLFWLIRSMWEIFGTELWPARIISLSAMTVFFILTYHLGRTLAAGQPGDTRHTGMQSMLMVAGLPLFLIYGSVIMFDTLMGVWVTAAMITLWQLAQGGKQRLWILYGVILGMGILAKGPVALIYMLPTALLARVWRGEAPTGWYKGLTLAILTGAMIGLAWAVPAALSGGDAYAQKIFVTQSAGRMVNAFDHREPFWFYIPVLLGFLAPLLLIPNLWSSMRTGLKTPEKKQALYFVLCWVLPVVLFFSIINSKQIHYMIPILPGFAALAALSLSGKDIKSVALPLAVMLLPSIVVMGYEIAEADFMGMKLPESTEHLGFAHIVLSLLIMWWAKRGLGSDRALVALAMGSFVMMFMVHAQLGQRFLPKYDLTPIAAAVQPYKARPMAAAPKYDGEYGYVMRMEKPIESIGREDMDAWFAVNPDGIVILRYKKPEQVAKYHVLYTQSFRPEEYLSIIEKK